MKKILFTLTCLVAYCLSQGQTMKEVTLNVVAKKYPEAKVAVDKLLADPKNANSAEGYYWKGFIYNFLAKDPVNKSLCTDCRMDAFNAIKKYMELDPSMKETKSDSNSLLYDMYLNYYDIAAKAYNSDSYQAAYDNFKNTLMVEDYIAGKNLPGPNGLRANSLDTSVILFCGFAASKLQKEDDAAAMYQKIIDAGLNDPKFLATYEDQAEFYLKKNEMDKWKDVVAKGKKAFPSADYWYQVEIDMIVKTADKETLTAKYDELVKQRPGSYVLSYNYAVELFNYIYINDTKPADIPKKKDRLTEILKSTIALDSGIEATVLMARHKDYASGDLMDGSIKIKGTKPEDVKKRNDIKASAIKEADEAISYAENAIKYYKGLEKLKSSQKNNINSMYDILSRAYELKGDAKKSADYQAQKKALQ